MFCGDTIDSGSYVQGNPEKETDWSAHNKETKKEAEDLKHIQDSDSMEEEELNMSFEAIEDSGAKVDKKMNVIFEANKDLDMLRANKDSRVIEGY